MINKLLSKPVLICLVLLIVACEKKQEISTDIYESVPAEIRSINITVEAAGIIEPETTIEVKSKASGEILVLNAETGDQVEQGALLVQIDKRNPGNIVDQAEADLEAARARRKIAATQLSRTKNLLDKGIVTETEYETSQLELANADAAVISKQVELENARIALEDTDVNAPITGIIIQKNVERGQVISSPTRDVGGGTILLKMADLKTVQVRTLVDETDIGKIHPDMQASVNVSAYPNQPFTGQVLKIEPQATVDQNVTMFPVLIRLGNPEGLLRPGMNAEVKINIVHAENVLAIPTMALRTDRDLSATASVLGITIEALQETLSKSRLTLGGSETSEGDDRRINSSNSAPGNRDNVSAYRERAPAGNTDDSQQSARRVSSIAYQYGGDYWVLLVSNNELEPRYIRTGITDLEYSEVKYGLAKGDNVLILPSSGLLERQERIQSSLNQRMRPPGM
jgi:HlyD family secretion protein